MDKSKGEPIWKDLGLRVGLEIHRQLAGEKLFCECPSDYGDVTENRIEREFNLTESELGEIDGAARIESEKRKKTTYTITDNSCLVELDEEPPHDPSKELVNRALATAVILGCELVPRIEFMRKIVIDGSNPSGFQRTAIIGGGGKIEGVENKHVRIESVCLEEDSARRIDRSSREDIFILDRQGIGEMEITTSPTIDDPDTCRYFAGRIGEILKSTGFFRSGIGTIRQDVNVSIRGGIRCELKLIQDLSLIPKVVKFEAARQMLLIGVMEILRERRITKEDLDLEPIDITHMFQGNNGGNIGKNIEEGYRIVCIPLPGMAGLLKRGGSIYTSQGGSGCSTLFPYMEKAGLGKEIIERVVIDTGVKDQFTPDVLLPDMISRKELIRIHSETGANPESDSFILVNTRDKMIGRVVKAIKKRVMEALDGVPPEVRKPLQDGSSTYMRPLSGSARMYPETDIPPFDVDFDTVGALSGKLSNDPLQLRKRVFERGDISNTTVEQIENMGYLPLLDMILERTGDASVFSYMVTQCFPELEREGFSPKGTGGQIYVLLVEKTINGEIAKEALTDILIDIHGSKEPGSDTDEQVRRVLDNYKEDRVSGVEGRKFIDELIENKMDLIEKLGTKAHGPLMGVVMSIYRGKLDGKLLSDMLYNRIKEVIGD